MLRLLILAALSLLPAASLSAQREPAPRITIISGSQPDGAATGLWLTLLRRRLEPAEVDSVARIRRARTNEEEAWARLVRWESGTWSPATDSLARLFDLAPLPAVTIVLGNRGAEDAFTHDSTTIGMDLAALQRVYGDAGQPLNRDRVNRFFRHEYVHTLQKRWLARYPFRSRSFLDDAVFDAWAEGLGNFFSLASDWRLDGNRMSPRATATLAELEPILVARLAGLACADSAEARRLLKGLSSGLSRRSGARCLLPCGWLPTREQIQKPFTGLRHADRRRSGSWPSDTCRARARTPCELRAAGTRGAGAMTHDP